MHGYASVQQLAAEHKELLRAIERGRSAGAEAAIRDHLERATAWLMEHVATRDEIDTAEAGASPTA